MFRKQFCEATPALLEQTSESPDRFSEVSPIRAEQDNDPQSVSNGFLLDSSFRIDICRKAEESISSLGERHSHHTRFRRGLLRETSGRRPAQPLLLEELEDWGPPRGNSLNSQLQETDSLNVSQQVLKNLGTQNGDLSLSSIFLRQDTRNLENAIPVDKN